MGIAKDGGFEENFLFVDTTVYLLHVSLTFILFQLRSLLSGLPALNMTTIFS